MCGLKSTSVVCISILDAYHFLIDSYRPYQLRNNNLAATFDGAHGRAVQARVGLRALHNATAENPNPLAVAGRVVAGQRGAGQKRSGTKRSGAKRSGTKTSEPAGGRRADRRIREALPAQWEI